MSNVPVIAHVLCTPNRSAVGPASAFDASDAEECGAQPRNPSAELVGGHLLNESYAWYDEEHVSRATERHYSGSKPQIREERQGDVRSAHDNEAEQDRRSLPEALAPPAHRKPPQHSPESERGL